MKRVFILGAGASKHVGYPLNKDLWTEISAWIRRPTQPSQYLRQLDEEISSSYPADVLSNFEVLLGEIQREITIGATSRNVLAIRRDTLIQSLLDFFREIRDRPAPAYDQFARERVHFGDTIVTFNYDISLEKELRSCGKWDVSTGYGFQLWDQDSSTPTVKVLKLHGSTNWFGDFFHGRKSFGQFDPTDIHGSRPGIPIPELSYLGYETERDPLFSGQGAIVRGIIPPYATKEYCIKTAFGTEWQPFWDDIWNQAAKALESADSVHILGYSMPDSDDRPRELLLSKANKNTRIEIASLSDTQRLKRMFAARGFANITASPDARFEDWVLEKAATPSAG